MDLRTLRQSYRARHFLLFLSVPTRYLGIPHYTLCHTCRLFFQGSLIRLVTIAQAFIMTPEPADREPRASPSQPEASSTQSLSDIVRKGHFKLSLSECNTVATLVLTLATGIFFALAVSGLAKSKGPDFKSPPLREDFTFWLLLSQIIPNVLSASQEIMKHQYDPDISWKTQGLLYIFPGLTLLFSVLAPITYAAMDQTSASREVVSAILAFLAILFANLNGCLGILDLARRKREKKQDIELEERAEVLENAQADFNETLDDAATFQRKKKQEEAKATAKRELEEAKSQNETYKCRIEEQASLIRTLQLTLEHQSKQIQRIAILTQNKNEQNLQIEDLRTEIAELEDVNYTQLSSITTLEETVQTRNEEINALQQNTTDLTAQVVSLREAHIEKDQSLELLVVFWQNRRRKAQRTEAKYVRKTALRRFVGKTKVRVTPPDSNRSSVYEERLLTAKNVPGLVDQRSSIGSSSESNTGS